MRKKTLVALLLGGLVLGAVAVAAVRVAPPDPLLEGFNAVETGIKSSQAVDLLGPPVYEGKLHPHADTLRMWVNEAVGSCLLVELDARRTVTWKQYNPPPSWWQRLLDHLE